MQVIKPGSHVIVREAGGGQVNARALSGIVPGSDFPVVWVCRSDKFDAAAAAGQEPPSVPCPAEAVTLVHE